MDIITVIGFALGTTYGLLLMQWPIIVTNTVADALDPDKKS